jgi:calcineurin-like phosphoesterase family protein
LAQRALEQGFDPEMRRFWRSNKAYAKPQLPYGTRVYAISDVHGCADLLGEIFTMIDADLARSMPPDPIHVFLGDYVDRGPDSSKTLDLLIQRSRTHKSVFLKGNHEAFMLEALRDPTKVEDWRQFGGLQTMISYGLQPSLNPDAEEQVDLIRRLTAALPDAHLKFLQHLKPKFICGDFCFVHAGVRPGIPLDEQQEADLLWIRNEFLESEENFGKYIVHGHTPVSEPDIRPNRINIDTGAYATGNLTLLTIEGSSMLAL